MATLYWWQAAATYGWTDHANPGPWWDDAAHTTQNTSGPAAGDTVDMRGSYGPKLTPYIAITDLLLDNAGFDFTCSSASTITGTVTVGTTYTFTYGIKQVGIKAVTGTCQFTIATDGKMTILTDAADGLYGVSATLGAMTDVFVHTGAVCPSIQFTGTVKVLSISNLLADHMTVFGSVLIIDTPPVGSSLVCGGGDLVFPIQRIGILASDVRVGVAGGTCTVPAKGNVKKDVAVDDGVGTLESTDPGIGNVVKNVAYKIESVAKVGTLDVTANNAPANGARARKAWL